MGLFSKKQKNLKILMLLFPHQKSDGISPDFDGFYPIEKNNNLIISDIYFWVKM